MANDLGGVGGANGGTININIQVNIQNLTNQLNQAQEAVQSFGSRMESTLANIANAGRAVTDVVHAIQGIGNAFKEVTEISAKMDGGMNSLTNALGTNAQAYTEWASTVASAYGIGKESAIVYGSNMAMMLQSGYKNQKDLTNATIGLMQDGAVVAARKGMEQQDVYSRLTSALQGHVAAVKQLDLNIKISAITADKAYKQIYGNAPWKKLTQEQQTAMIATVMHEQILKKFGATIGDTLDAKVLQFGGALENLRVAWAEAFAPVLNFVLPVLTQLIGYLETALEFIDAFLEAFFGYTPMFSQVASGMAGLGGAVADTGNAYDGLANSADKAMKAINGAGNASSKAKKAHSGGSGGSSSKDKKKEDNGFLASFDQIHNVPQNPASASGLGAGGLGGIGGGGIGGIGGGGIGGLGKGLGGIGGGKISNPFKNAIDGMKKFTDGVNKFKKMFAGVAKFMKDHPLFAQFARWGAIIVGLGVPIALVIKKVIGMWKAFSTGIKAFRDLAKGGKAVSEAEREIGSKSSIFSKLWGLIKKGSSAIGKLAKDFMRVLRPLERLKSLGKLALEAVQKGIIKVAEWAGKLWRGFMQVGKFLLEYVVAPLAEAIGLPEELVAVALVALALLVIYVIKHWDDIKKGFKKMCDAIGKWWKGFIDDAKTKMDEWGTWLKTEWDKLTSWFDKTLVKPMEDRWNTWVGNMKKLAGEAYKGVTDAFNGISSWFSGHVISPLESLFGKLASSFKNTLNSIIGGANSIIGKINGVSGKVGIPAIPNIPKLANGGITNGEMLATIGDNVGGHEVVTPLDKLQGFVTNAVLNANRFSGGSSGGGGSNGGSITLNIDGRTFARVMKPYMDNETRRVGNNIRLNTV